MELHPGYSDTPPPPVFPPEERPKIVRNREITGWRIRMFYMTRDLHLLFWLAVVIVGIGIFIGSRATPKKGGPVAEDVSEGDSFEVSVDEEGFWFAGGTSGSVSPWIRRTGIVTSIGASSSRIATPDSQNGRNVRIGSP